MADQTGRLIGRYQVLEPLGSGGMAVVYRAYDKWLEREVALKLIRMEAFPAEDHERVLKRFDREAHALAKLSHPGIVRVYDYGEHDGAPYLVMEYLGGRTLKEREEKRLPAARAAELLMPVAEALAYAHGQGILHRDVKPSNILLNDVGEAVLTDFGIAKVLEGNEEQTLTGTGVGVGTPEYMAPEQGLGGEVDGRADVYSLGVVLYELVTGEKPYTAETPMAVVIKQVNDPIPLPSIKVPELPESIDRVLLKALAKKPENRYQNMDEFGNVLRQIAEGKIEAPATDVENEHELMMLLESEIQQEDETVDHLETAKIREVNSGESGAELPLPPSHSRRPWLWAAIVLVLAGGLVEGWRWLDTINIGDVDKTETMVAISAMETEAEEYIRLTAEQTDLDKQVSSGVNGELLTATLDIKPSEAVTPAPTLGIGSTRTSEVDGMVQVYVPAGSFLMGSTEADGDAEDDEFPQHDVYLDAYWIDQIEITNGMYAKCVDAGVCSLPSDNSSMNRTYYYGIAEYQDYPVIWISWFQAEAYCEWVERRLPSEAEWEKAARGTEGWLYPWGNEPPDGNRANYCDQNCINSFADRENNDGYADTSPVRSYPEGVSIFGAFDMSGNVWEWVQDWHGPYSDTFSSNPAGPDHGDYRVLRGGAFNSPVSQLRTTERIIAPPGYALLGPEGGFRCAFSGMPAEE